MAGAYFSVCAAFCVDWCHFIRFDFGGGDVEHFARHSSAAALSFSAHTGGNYHAVSRFYPKARSFDGIFDSGFLGIKRIVEFK